MEIDSSRLIQIAKTLPLLVLFPVHEIVLKSIILYFYDFNFKIQKNRIYYLTENYRMIIKSIVLNSLFLGIWFPVDFSVQAQKYYSLKRKYLNVLNPFIISIKIFLIYIVFCKFETKILLKIFYSVYVLHTFVQKPIKKQPVEKTYDQFTFDLIQNDFKNQVETIAELLKSFTVKTTKEDFKVVKEDERNTLNIVKSKKTVMDTVVSYLVEEENGSL